MQKLTIFVAAPSDMKAERDTVKAVASALKPLADRLGIVLEVANWSSVVPDTGRPEQVILDQIQPTSWDVFIGILWHRFGTPPGGINPTTHKEYLSGTEEEFQIAYRLWQQRNRPRILMYRCTRQIPQDVLIPDQYQRVQEFFKQFEAIAGENPGLYQTFNNKKGFEKLLFDNIQKLLLQYGKDLGISESQGVLPNKMEREGDERKEQPSQNRVLEAAIEKQVIVGRPVSLYVRVRRQESKNIISVVSSTDEYVHLDEDNIKTKDLEIEFPIINGQVLPAGITLKLVAHEFTPSFQKKKIYIPPKGDSEVCTFIVTPKKTGELLLSLEVLKDEVSLGNKNLRTTAIDTEKKVDNSLVLMTIPIIVRPSKIRGGFLFAAISVMVVVLAVIGLNSKSIIQAIVGPSSTPDFTHTPTFTPTSTSTHTPTIISTPYICPFQGQTDNETIVKLIKAEASASNSETLSIILKIFSPNAVFYDYTSDPPKQWIGPRTRYEKVLFPTTDFKGVEHFDILPAGQGIVGDVAYYTSGSRGSFLNSEGKWEPFNNGSLISTTPTPYGSDHWILEKDNHGCWVIIRMEFNAGHIAFPP